MFETLVIRVVRAFHIEGSKVLMVKRAWLVGLGWMIEKPMLVWTDRPIVNAKILN